MNARLSGAKLDPKAHKQANGLDYKTYELEHKDGFLDIKVHDSFPWSQSSLIILHTNTYKIDEKALNLYHNDHEVYYKTQELDHKIRGQGSKARSKVGPQCKKFKHMS